GEALHPPASGRAVQASSAHGGDELGVLGVERALDLFELSLLVLGEWHDSSSGTGVSVAPETGMNASPWLGTGERLGASPPRIRFPRREDYPVLTGRRARF